MFEMLTSPDGVLAFTLSGKMTGQDVAQYRAALKSKLIEHSYLGLCVDFSDLSDLDAEALVEGVKADLEFLGHLDQFGRCALVSDKEWPHAAIGFVQPVFPTLEMKAFTSDRRDEAMQWAASVRKRSVAKTPAFRFIPTTEDNVFGFAIDGVISGEEMPYVIEEFEKFLSRHDKVRLLNRMNNFGGVDPSAFMQGGLVSMKLAAMQKVERYAIVGAPNWMGKVIENLNPVFPDIDIRVFSVDKEEEAWAWLGATPAKRGTSRGRTQNLE